MAIHSFASNVQHSDQTQHAVNNNRVYVFVPLQLQAGENKSGFIHGSVKHGVNCVSLYVNSVSVEGQTGRLCLLGSWNNNNEAKPESCSHWIQLRSQMPGCIGISSLEVNHTPVSLPDAVLILYDQSLLQSEILDSNIDWRESQCLRELGKLRHKNNASSKTVNDANSHQISESFVNASKVITQLRQRALQFFLWRRTRSELSSLNLLFMVILDLLMGFFFLEVFHSVGGTNKVLEMFLTSVKVNTCNYCILHVFNF